MKKLASILDKIASELEAQGLGRLAFEVDTVANELEKNAFTSSPAFQSAEAKLYQYIKERRPALDEHEVDAVFHDLAKHLTTSSGLAFKAGISEERAFQIIKNNLKGIKDPYQLLLQLEPIVQAEFGQGGTHESQGLMNKPAPRTQIETRQDEPGVALHKDIRN